MKDDPGIERLELNFAAAALVFLPASTGTGFVAACIRRINGFNRIFKRLFLFPFIDQAAEP